MPYGFYVNFCKVICIVKITVYSKTVKQFLNLSFVKNFYLEFLRVAADDFLQGKLKMQKPGMYAFLNIN